MNITPSQTEEFIFDLIDSKWYISELEKLKRNDGEIVLKVNLKAVLARKMRSRIWGYLQREYLYLVTERGLTLTYKTYNISKRKDIL